MIFMHANKLQMKINAFKECRENKKRRLISDEREEAKKKEANKRDECNIFYDFLKLIWVNRIQTN